jgi:hypothetical protein
MFLAVSPIAALIAWASVDYDWPLGLTVAVMFVVAIATGPFATRDPDPPRRRRGRRP